MTGVVQGRMISVILAALSGDSPISDGLGIALFGLIFVLAGRSDLGRFMQPTAERSLSKSMSPDQARRFVNRLRRRNNRFAQVMGWFTVLFGLGSAAVHLIGMWIR